MARIWVIAALSCLVTAAVASARGGEPSVDTFATLSWTDNEEAGDYFDGRLQSPEKKCVKRRRLVLLRRANGEEVKVDRGRSNRRGSFRIDHEDPGSGRYFLEVKPERRGSIPCGGSLTGALDVTDLEAV